MSLATSTSPVTAATIGVASNNSKIHPVMFGSHPSNSRPQRARKRKYQTSRMWSLIKATTHRCSEPPWRKISFAMERLGD